MILVILAICIAMFIYGIYRDKKYSRGWNDDGVGMAFMIVGAFIGIVALGATLVLGCCVSNVTVIDERIAMYQEENTKIEEQIATVVSEYQEYEKGIISEVKPESAITYVSLYPDLKADSLVQSQIEVYVSNNNKIKELRDQKISGSVYRWWLYFGGTNKE